MRTFPLFQYSLLHFCFVLKWSLSIYSSALLFENSYAIALTLCIVLFFVVAIVVYSILQMHSLQFSSAAYILSLLLFENNGADEGRCLGYAYFWFMVHIHMNFMLHARCTPFVCISIICVFIDLLCFEFRCLLLL